MRLSDFNPRVPCNRQLLLLTKYFSYDSANNEEWLNAEQIRQEIRLHVDAEFEV